MISGLSRYSAILTVLELRLDFSSQLDPVHPAKHYSSVIAPFLFLK